MACVLSAGCAVIPIPMRRHVPIGYFTRASIDAQTLDLVRRGATTRADILLLLGEPDSAWSGQRSFLYRWTTVRGYVLWFLGGGYQGVAGVVPVGRRPHDLVVEFDEDGVLNWMGDIRTWRSGQGTREALPDSILRVELPARHRHAGDSQPGALTLADDGICFEEPRRPRHGAAILCDRVRSLDHDVILQQSWKEGGVGCTLDYATVRILAE